MAAPGPIAAIIVLLVANIIFYLSNENSFIKTFLTHKGCLFMYTNGRANASRPKLFLAWDTLDPLHSISSTVSIRVLIAYRCGEVLYFLFELLCQGLWGSGFPTPPLDWLTFFTNWTFTGFALFAVLGIIILVEHLYTKSSNEQEEWTFLRKLVVLMFQTISAASLFLAIFYWAVIYDGNHVEFDNVMRHGLNVVVLFGDLFLSRIPVVSYHYEICFLYGSIYIVFMWIYHAVSGDWVYEALDWNKSNSTIYYIIVPILLLITYAIVYGVALLREKVLVGRTKLEAYKSMTPGGDVEMGTVENQGIDVL